MTDHGPAYALQRLSDAPDLAALRRVYASLSDEYREHPQVIAHAKKLAEGFK